MASCSHMSTPRDGGPRSSQSSVSVHIALLGSVCAPQFLLGSSPMPTAQVMAVPLDEVKSHFLLEEEEGLRAARLCPMSPLVLV